MQSFNQHHLSAGLTKLVLTLLIGVSLVACGDSGVEVTTEFRDSQGVREGAKVYFEGRGVGEVIGVKQQESGSLITMSIDKEAASTIDSSAAVVVNRIKPGSPLELYPSSTSDSMGLQEGQQLHGLNSMIELVAWSVGDAIEFGTGELSGYVDSFQDYLQGEKFEQDRARVEAGVKAMAAVASDAIKTVEQDLAKAMSEVSVSEQELASAIEELGDGLTPIAEEMAKSGTDLMAELEKFANGLENATEEEQQSRQQLIDSLIATIEKLNEAAQNDAANTSNTQAKQTQKPSNIAE